MHTALLRQIRRHVARHRLWPRGARVVAALSGGSDSVAQLLLLRDLAADGDVVLAGAAHLNHRLRDDAARDEAFCRALCDRLGLPCVVDHATVPELAASSNVSVEVAARRVRYAFLEEARRALSADAIAVAHTADDQAETVLLRLLRGAGPRGLRGVLPRRGAVVRPVLACTRADLQAMLAARQESWVEDTSNADVSMPRNRVRHELLPLLTGRFQPAVTRVLARTAEVVGAEDALLERLAGSAEATVVMATPKGLRLSTTALAALPVALARRVARRALERLAPVHAPDLADVDLLLSVCRADGPPAAQPAGLRVERFSPDAVLLIRESELDAPSALAVRTLTVPGQVELPELGAGCRLRAERPIKTEGRPEGSRWSLTLKAPVPLPLFIRSRAAGDRMRPRGAGGSRKLQDLLVDRKVPRRERDRVPVVTDAAGRILWVVGHAVAAEAAAAGGEDDVIVLTFDQPAVAGSEGS